MRISDWSSDVCSSDLEVLRRVATAGGVQLVDLDQHLRKGEAGHGAVDATRQFLGVMQSTVADEDGDVPPPLPLGRLAQRGDLGKARALLVLQHDELRVAVDQRVEGLHGDWHAGARSEEHTSALQSLMRL